MTHWKIPWCWERLRADGEEGVRGWEMAGWYQWFSELGQTLGDGERQGGLVCCSPWDHKESDTTGWLNNNRINNRLPQWFRGKKPPTMRELQGTWVRSLGQEDPLDHRSGTATHSNILASRISRTKEPGGVQSIGLQRVGNNWSDFVWNGELPDIQAWFRKGRGTRNQIANIRWILEEAREFQKKSYTSASLC